MKHTYDDYDFEKLYSDVNEFSYDTERYSFQVIDSCYDTYTGSSDDFNYYWN